MIALKYRGQRILLHVGPSDLRHYQIVMKLHNKGKEVGRTLLAAFLSTILSASGYLLLTPILAPRLSVISYPIESLPWWAPAAQKLFESTLLSIATLSNCTASLDVANK